MKCTNDISAMMREHSQCKNNAKNKTGKTIIGIAAIMACIGLGVFQEPKVEPIVTEQKTYVAPVPLVEPVVVAENKVFDVVIETTATESVFQVDVVEAAETVEVEPENKVMTCSYSIPFEEPDITMSATRDIDTQAVMYSRGYFTESVLVDEDPWYIPVITLDYADEQMEMPYSHQKHLWDVCQERDVDYWTMMSIVARESRFDPTVENSGHYGYMQIANCAEECAEQRLGVALDKYDPYDNLTIGVEYYLDCYERAGYKYGAHWAYVYGYWGYLEEIENGETSNYHVDKALKFEKLLTDTELNPRA